MFPGRSSGNSANAKKHHQPTQSHARREYDDDDEWDYRFSLSDGEDEDEDEDDAPLLTASQVASGSTSSAPTAHIKMQRIASKNGTVKGDDSIGSDAGAEDTVHSQTPLTQADGGKVKGTDDRVRTEVRPAGRRRGSSEDDGEYDDGDSDDGQGNLSLDDLFDETKTAHENKSVLLSYELDRMGFGRYQTLLWCLCGLGYFIDLLWAQALGLIITPVLNEFNQGNGRSGLLSTSFSVGLTIGAFMWGFLVDVIGRKWSFYLTCLIASIFGLASGGANSYATLCGLMALVGIGVGGNIPIDATITLEFLPTKRRFLVAALSIFQPVGVLVCSGIAYGFIPFYSCALSPDRAEASVSAGTPCARADNMGWRYTLFTLGAITLFIFFARFAVFRFRESPFYLLSRGRERDALRVIRQISDFNRARCRPKFTLDDFAEIDKRLGVAPLPARGSGKDAGEGTARVKSHRETIRESAVAMLRNFGNARLLFATPLMARLTVLIWITFISDFWAFSIAGTFLPQILLQKGASLEIPLSTTYANFMAIYAPGIAACALAAAMVEVPRFGRQWFMVFSSAMMAISLFLYSVVTTQAGSVGINAMEYFFQSAFNATLYAFVCEAYPSSVRGTASGLASTWGRLASILAPIAGQSLFGRSTQGNANINGVLYVGGGVALAAPVALALLPFDTRGRRTY